MSSLWTSISNSIPTTLYKRLFKFLLKRAIGQFLSSDLDLDNLEVQLGNGVVVLRELELNLEVNLLSVLFTFSSPQREMELLPLLYLGIPSVEKETERKTTLSKWEMTSLNLVRVVFLLSLTTHPLTLSLSSPYFSLLSLSISFYFYFSFPSSPFLFPFKTSSWTNWQWTIQFV